ncbi:bifunctional MaoC family dehydratase N-terminal/OB-fold nucleic acid binding domain-containing protein [Actinomycetes bacterium KLBMP 9797]
MNSSEDIAAAADRSEDIMAAADRIRAAGLSPPRHARDPVNVPMVRNWLEAMGDANPVYERDGLAPPAMTQVWTMRGLRPAPDPDDPLAAISAVLDRAGFTSVVATNSEQTYHRYLREGERVAVRSRLADVAGPKRTALGEGWFATIESTWYVGDEPVAAMRFRILKFRPAPSREGALTPVVSPDTAFFWAGTAARELRIQRCEACGARRHPPGPACPRCGSLRMGHLVAAGTGEIYSYVVHHHPPVPGRAAPFVVALVALPEGVRVVGELLDADPRAVRIGAPVRVDFVRVDPTLNLPAWRLA